MTVAMRRNPASLRSALEITATLFLDSVPRTTIQTMISNERPSPYGRRPYQGQSYSSPPKPVVQEDTLLSAEVQVERKVFIFTLKENPRGRFLRITENSGSRRDTMIIPSTGLEDFQRVVHELVAAAKAMPAPTAAPDDSQGNR